MDVGYTVDVKEAYHQVNEGQYELAFLLKLPQTETVKFIADAQERMPSKPTCVYPRVPGCLVINPLD